MLEFQEIPYELSEDCKTLRIKSNGADVRIKRTKAFDNEAIKKCITGLLQILNFPTGSVVYGITPRNILIHAGVPFEKGIVSVTSHDGLNQIWTDRVRFNN